MGKIILSAFLCVFFSCKSQENNTTSLQIISEKVGDNAIIDYNLDRTFALIQEKYAIVQQGDYTSRFLIIKLDNNQVIREGKVVNGYIKWIDENIIEIFEMPGVMKDGQSEKDFKEHIDVRKYLSERKRKKK